VLPVITGCTFGIPALRRLRKEDGEFQVHLGFLVRHSLKIEKSAYDKNYIMCICGISQ
jgi:hypothetical protein